MPLIYTSWVIFTCLLVFQNVFCSKEFKCGAEKKCACSGNENEQTKMDCSNTMLNLSDMCLHVGNATYLDASSNNITRIKNKIALNGCQNLSVLLLRNNTMIRFADDAFSAIRTLTFLDLSLNNLDVYRTENRTLFTELPALKKLLMNLNFLQGEQSRDMAYPDLSALHALETLYIDGLTNTDFGSNYAQLEHLVTVHLSGSICTCELGNLTRYTFQNLKMIKTLNISVCKIINIEAETFQILHHLETLDLSQNQRLGFQMLRNVSYGLQFTNIKFLNYTKVYNTFGLGTKIRKRDICYLRNTTIREFAVSSNRIELFETNSLQLFPKTLQILHINDNQFTFAPYLVQLACVANGTAFYGSFQHSAHPPNLFYTEPEENHATDDDDDDDCPYMRDEILQNISNSVRNCEFIKPGKLPFSIPPFSDNLKTVLFNDCNMQYTLPTLPLTPHNTVNHLDLSGNILHSWVGPIGPLSHLKFLDLSRNYCSRISENFFAGMPNLENLQLQNNFIGLVLQNESVTIFENLTKLKTLNLTANIITTIPSISFRTLRNLETLDLSLNSLKDWKIDVANLVNLTHINIRFNVIKTLPLQLSTHLSEVSKRRNVPFSIDMRNNPIQCTCQYQEFLIWMLQNREHFVQFESNIFLDENDKQIAASDIERTIKDFSKNCRSYTQVIVLCCIGISIFLSIVIGGVIYRNRWKLRYFFYMSKVRYFGYTIVPDDGPIENYKHDAFISYAEENIRFIRDGIIPILEEEGEEGNEGMSLCIHQRSFIPGKPIVDNIIDAIQSSRKTVVILTEVFLKRKWCLYEFHFARMESIYSRDGSNSLVIVMLEDIPTKDMPLEMLEWIRTNSYIEYTTDIQGQDMFWDNLKDAIRQ